MTTETTTMMTRLEIENLIRYIESYNLRPGLAADVVVATEDPELVALVRSGKERLLQDDNDITRPLRRIAARRE